GTFEVIATEGEKCARIDAYLCDPDTGQYVCLRAGRVFLVAQDSASRAGRGALTPEAVAACVEGGPAGVGWLARLAVLAGVVGLDPPAALSADCDGDGDVDLADFALLASSFDARGGATYTWDAENRLVAVTPACRVIGGDRKVEFGYDYLGRRVVKRVYAWNGSAWVPPESEDECAVRKFVYDGWRVIMELDGSNDDAVLRKHTWGLDLSGSLEGAGGIGGLLGTLDTAGTTDPGDDRTFIYFCDANGNVGQVMETTAGQKFGTVAAHYVYTPYGARLNTPPSGHDDYDQPFRFSTKWFDAETGFGYWGYRYYSPTLGRWMSKDPIEEEGGWNLYEYVSSGPTLATDPIGLSTADVLADFWAQFPNVTYPRYLGPDALNVAGVDPFWNAWNEYKQRMLASHKYTAQELDDAQKLLKARIKEKLTPSGSKGGKRKGGGGRKGGGALGGAAGAAAIIILTDPDTAYAPEIPYWGHFGPCEKVHCLCQHVMATNIVPPWWDLFGDNEYRYSFGPWVDHGVIAAKECQALEWFSPEDGESWFYEGSSVGYRVYWREWYGCKARGRDGSSASR
ncbi:MAG TPA: RHS repeat-associated core domain-containing protein, partial [Phycisphaerae bacterium]|nr:RHS repeat-associated core domain-containing protein [Phycisphaerae bacterium]